MSASATQGGHKKRVIINKYRKTFFTSLASTPRSDSRKRKLEKRKAVCVGYSSTSPILASLVVVKRSFHEMWLVADVHTWTAMVITVVATV